MWDLFELDSDNGAWGKRSELGTTLARLDNYTLDKLKDWLEENADQAIERHGFSTWHALRTRVGLSALLKPLPPKMQLLPDTWISAVRADGKLWDLSMPVRAELLRRTPRYFGERRYAELLGVSRNAYRRLRDEMKREGFSLGRFTPDVLWRIVYGKKRGPERKH